MATESEPISSTILVGGSKKSYYLDGNQASKTDSTGTTTYVYDGLGRLTSETNPNTLSKSYQYDKASNRSFMTVSGSENYVTNYKYDKNNRLTQEEKTSNSIIDGTDYYYDLNGNQISALNYSLTPSTSGSSGLTLSLLGKDASSKNVRLNQYDAFNRLTSVLTGDKEVSYTYTADGLRNSKTVNGTKTTHIWDGTQMACELDNAGTMSSVYLRGNRLIANSDGTNMAGYYLYNGHGDVVQLSNNSGTVTKNYQYDAFGNEVNKDDADTNPFRYSGEYFDKETGSIYLRARYYDPEVGRFLTEDPHWHTGNMIYGDDPKDPLGLNIYTPDINTIRQSSNLYVYCMNNAVMYVDPTGELVPAAIAPAVAELAPVVVEAAVTFGPIIYNAVKGSNIQGFDVAGNAVTYKSYTKGHFRDNLTTYLGQAPASMLKPEAHHVYPQALESDFKKAGIEIHRPEYGAWVEASKGILPNHQTWSAQYNKDWKTFFQSYKDIGKQPTVKDIEAKAKALANQYDFKVNF